MKPNTSVETSKPAEARSRALFGIGIAVFLLYLVTYEINVRSENDWYKEAWPAYQLLIHGHVLGFLQRSPGYVGSLVMRAPLALIAGALGASGRTGYIVTGLPLLLAPGLFAGYLAINDPRPAPPRPSSQKSRSAAPAKRRFGLRPVDLFMVTPCAIVCVSGGHPEDVFGSVLCVLAVLLAYRGSGRTAGFLIAVALINKTWAIVVFPFVFAVMPADRRMSSFITAVVTAGIVLVPVVALRMTSAGGGSSAGSALGDQTNGFFLIPQLLWWFGWKSWIAVHAHVLLVIVDWLVTAAWWVRRVRGRSQPPSLNQVLLALALLLFLRAALDPWDNMYYLAPFILTVMTLEEPGGFPKLSWIYTILIVLIVPPLGVLEGLGPNGHAAVFTAFALVTIAYFGRRAFSANESKSLRSYTVASGSPTSPAPT